MKPYEINYKSVLCVPDYHQDVEFVKAIFAKEKDNYDAYVMMGDNIDSWYNPPRVYGAAETAEFMVEMQGGKYGKGYFLAGNHDLPVMEAWRWNQRFQNPHRLNNVCSGYTNSKAKNMNHVLKWEHWRNLKAFYLVNGYLVSHAGFLPNFWTPYLTNEQNLDKLWEETERALEEISFTPSPYFAAGFARGGNTKTPGPFWCDFIGEFIDGLPYPQIVSHTCDHETIKKIGNSYCIDGSQSTYAILHEDGTLDFKMLRGQQENGKIVDWIEAKPFIKNMLDNRGKISENWKY